MCHGMPASGPGNGPENGPLACAPGAEQALDACGQSQINDACSFVVSDGTTLTGTCQAAPLGLLACMPTIPHAVPPAAVVACSGKQEGDPCSF
jgi:hypothetical protein